MSALKMIKEKFGAQVFVAISALVFLLSLIFITVLFRFQQNTLTAGLERDGKLLSQMLAYQSRIALYAENETMLQMPVEASFQNESVLEVSMFNQDKVLVFEEKRDGGLSPEVLATHACPGIETVVSQLPHASSPLMWHSKEFLVVWEAVIMGSTFLAEDSIYANGRTSERPEDVVGYVRIIMGKKQLREQLRTTLGKTIALGVVFLIIGGFITFYLARQIHRPIKLLTGKVRKFGEDGTYDDIRVNARNEIGQLSGVFQEMAIALKDHVQREIDTAKELAHNRNLAQLGVASGKVTHEVGNLLNNMAMVLPALESEVFSRKGLGRVAILKKEAERLKVFVSDFLQFARQPVLKKQTAPLELTIRELLVMHQHLSSDLEIDLLLDWPIDIPPIAADHRMLSIAIGNLVTNGIEAIGRNGTIIIFGRIEAGNLVITVKDTGPGIDSAVVEKIFDPFFTTKGKQGTGLGLSIVQGVVQGHGGTIVCESDPGVGTRFVIRLPMSTGAASKS